MALKSGDSCGCSERCVRLLTIFCAIRPRWLSQQLCTALVIKASVPMSETLNYSAFLSSATGGRGSFTLEMDRYEEMPGHLADKVIAAKKHVEEEEE